MHSDVTMPQRLRPRADTAYEQARDLGGAAAIRTAWATSQGSGQAVARALGISRSTLYREIERLQIGADLDGYRPRSAIVS